ncbi:hypothetical protein MC885_016416 [Smutsia gigantea]|nr:hypothetical protein MC885_016416 [Smutsia gigantea]
MGLLSRPPGNPRKAESPASGHRDEQEPLGSQPQPADPSAGAPGGPLKAALVTRCPGFGGQSVDAPPEPALLALLSCLLSCVSLGLAVFCSVITATDSPTPGVSLQVSLAKSTTNCSTFTCFSMQIRESPVNHFPPTQVDSTDGKSSRQAPPRSSCPGAAGGGVDFCGARRTASLEGGLGGWHAGTQASLGPRQCRTSSSCLSSSFVPTVDVSSSSLTMPGSVYNLSRLSPPTASLTWLLPSASGTSLQPLMASAYLYQHSSPAVFSGTQTSTSAASYPCDLEWDITGSTEKKSSSHADFTVTVTDQNTAMSMTAQ